ncbi:serine/threonine-protein kinase [Streptomyces stelliscabiei]|uniref:serine/threonine-protein kinase n=1 Tax=Streptomyces stelliscabiei TaxID=146820 RepID=UPI002FF190B0
MTRRHDLTLRYARAVRTHDDGPNERRHRWTPRPPGRKRERARDTRTRRRPDGDTCAARCGTADRRPVSAPRGSRQRRYGTVWRAHDQLLDRPVAAKELHILTHGDEERRVRMRRAVREARAVARVPHPHVVGIHDLVEAEDRLWIVMELVAGPSLAGRIAQGGPLTPRHAAALGLQMLAALEAVHAAGALHRDVKPANVLLRRDDDAVLTDFGIAALDDGEFLTGTGQLVGSLEYMAPERVTGTRAAPPPTCGPWARRSPRSVADSPPSAGRAGPRPCTPWRTRSPSCRSGSARCGRSSRRCCANPPASALRRPACGPRWGASRRARPTPGHCPRRPCVSPAPSPRRPTPTP